MTVRRAAELQSQVDELAGRLDRLERRFERADRRASITVALLRGRLHADAAALKALEADL